VYVYIIKMVIDSSCIISTTHS